VTRRRRTVRPFTPSNEPTAALAARTVGRDDLLALLDRRLYALATSANRPHTLLVGPRGAGKTHLIEVALYQAAKHEEFQQRVQVVRLDEDMIGIGSYSDVLREILTRLPHPDAAGPQVRTANPEAAIARALGDRSMVLVIENLDKLFRALGTSGQQDLRAWVENSRSVMLLATTPMLFPGVQDRRQPWYGNFGVSHLEELTVADGAALLSHVASERGDEELVRFLRTDRGVARLQAINQLAGGSPRIWMILSDCISVELLDELTPAVEALMEGLVPYYQQLLWELSINEQRLVRALADGSTQAMTVTALAEETGIEQRSAATSLGRLARARWVQAEKPAGLDQRTTWYRLREPLLRHHLHYRSAKDQPLPLIVDLLRAWFDPEQRRTHLLGAAPGSTTESLLVGSLSREPHRFNSAYAARDIDTLLVDARQWITGADRRSRTPEAGALIEFGVLLARNGPDAARASLQARVEAGLVPTLLAAADGVTVTEDAIEADRVGLALATLAERQTGRTRDVLSLISASWDGSHKPVNARDRLSRLAAKLRANSSDDVLGLDVRREYAFWMGKAGDPVGARKEFIAVLADCMRVLGPDHSATLGARYDLADSTGEAGDPAGGREQLTELLADCMRLLGPDHWNTLGTRGGLAHWTGEAGEPVGAREQLAGLVADCTRTLGPDHPDTLDARYSLARWTGEAGDRAAARDQFAGLVADSVRVLGADHPDTLDARCSLARWTGETGDWAAARDQLADLVADSARILGADHADTLIARYSLAHATGEAGDPARARDQFADLVADSVRVLGPDHADTLDARYGLARWTGEAGDRAAARDQFANLVADRGRVLGPDHAHTLSARYSLAYWTGEAGDPARARDQFADLVADSVRVLGPDHADTLDARYGLAYSTGDAGNQAAARDQFADLVADSARVLGADHPDTLIARYSLAYSTGESGDPAGAYDQYASLYADHSRISGPKSASALEIQIEALQWMSKTGRAAEAVQRLISLAAEGNVSSDSSYRAAVGFAIGETVLDFLNQSDGTSDPIDERLPAAGLLAELRAAVTGNPEALARIPTEVVPVVTEVRERRGEP
jgi:AAA domain